MHTTWKALQSQKVDKFLRPQSTHLLLLHKPTKCRVGISWDIV